MGRFNETAGSQAVGKYVAYRLYVRCGIADYLYIPACNGDRSVAEDFVRLNFQTSQENSALLKKGMKKSELAVIVSNTINSPDLNKLEPMKKAGNQWTGQLKAIVNLLPCGGFLAQELQNITDAIEDYKAAEFFRKFTVFVTEISDTTEEERVKFSKEVEKASKDYSGNVILGLIDRLDNINKQNILANLTRARIHDNISIEDYFRISSMLERIPYVDIEHLVNYAGRYYDDNGDSELLFATGALRLAEINANDHSRYVLSRLGEKLLQYGVGIELSVEREVGTAVSPDTMTEEDIKKMFEDKLGWGEM